MKYAYYNITLPKKTYVARAYCISMLVREFYEQFSFDDADDDDRTKEFLAFEPLDGRYTVKGVDAKDALDAAYTQYKMGLDETYEEIKGEVGEEEADEIMNEEYGYADAEATPIILEADPEHEFNLYLNENDELIVITEAGEILLSEYEDIIDLNV